MTLKTKNGGGIRWKPTWDGPSCKPGAIDATKLRLRNSLTWIALKCESCQIRKISKHWKCVCGNPWYTCATHASPLFGPVIRPQKRRPNKRKYVAVYKGTIEKGRMRQKNRNVMTDGVLWPCAGHDSNDEKNQEYNDSEEDAGERKFDCDEWIDAPPEDYYDDKHEKYLKRFKESYAAGKEEAQLNSIQFSSIQHNS